MPDYAVIKLSRHIVQGERPDTIVRGIDEAIQALPEGYDTVCTDGIFSQGEWQLLSIARAAAADPTVLLLDEITANLDAETEARGTGGPASGLPWAHRPLRFPPHL